MQTDRTEDNMDNKKAYKKYMKKMVKKYKAKETFSAVGFMTDKERITALELLLGKPVFSV